MNNIKCPKCGGSGHIKMYNHIDDGICFNCGGSGFVNSDDEIIKKNKIIKKNNKTNIWRAEETKKQKKQQQQIDSGYYKKQKMQKQAEAERVEELEYNKLTGDEKYKKSAQYGFDVWYKYLDE